MKRRALKRRYGHGKPPKFVPGTRVAFGKERTPAQCRARAEWERVQARALEGKPYGDILGPGHLKAAEEYEWLARKRERDPVGRHGKSRG